MRFRFDQYVLDEELRELKRADLPVALQPQVFDLLLYLIQERERVVSKDDLISRIWQDRAVSDSSLNSRINAARQAIGDDGHKQRLIQTVARKGFRFIGQVREETSGSQRGQERSAPQQPEPDRPAIAVLAFENMSDDPEQDYFCDGISEDILTALSKVRWFLVISRNSSFAYKGLPVHLRQISEELGVRYLVEGSVRKSGERLRITAQLNDTTTGAHLWAEQYEHELGDVFAIQDEITNAIVVAIEPQIYTAENFRAKRKAPDNMDAWDLLMRALSHFWRMTRQDHLMAQALLERAVALHPGCAQAWSLLAASQMVSVHMGWMELSGVAQDAQRAALMAVQLDHEDAWTHTALGSVRFSAGSIEDALSEYEVALRLNPNFCLAQGYYALALAHHGQQEDAFKAAQHAIRLSPRDPSLGIYYGICGYVRFAQCRYDEAIAHAREAIRHRGDLTGAYRVLVVAAAMSGDNELARTALTELRRLQPNISLNWIATQLPWQSATDREHYVEGFRRAGLN